jgi:hypothetical protein
MTTEEIIIPPNSDINKACDLLDQLIHNFLEARDTITTWGKFEAPVECLNLLYLMSRNIASITLMARHDLVLLPGAVHLTRSVFEMAIKVLWMLNPSDEFEREVHWLAQLQTEVTYFKGYSDRLRVMGSDNSDAVKSCEYTSGYMEEVVKVLPKPYKPLKKIPNMYEMMDKIGARDKYLDYMYMSQFTHSTHVATGVYRRGLGNDAVFGEYIRPDDWRQVFSLCWYSFDKSGNRILEVLGGDIGKFYTDDFIQEFERTIQGIKNSEE